MKINFFIFLKRASFSKRKLQKNGIFFKKIDLSRTFLRSF
jgi:hypothetical protein